jgi:hypothetical protein
MLLNINEFSKSKELTVVSVIEDRDYFLWQQEVQSLFLKESFPHLKTEVIVLYENDQPSRWARHIGSLTDTSYYRVNEARYKEYKPSYKPLGIHYRINDNSKNKLKNILAIDSDVIINKELDYFNILEGKDWVMSDCENYLGYTYLRKCISEDRIEELGNIVGITKNQIQSIEIAGGAQYLYKNVDEYQNLFEKIAKDSVSLFKRLNEISKEDNSKIQVWTAEMWSQLWNAKINPGISVRESMDFCWAPDSIEEMNIKTFTHFAGKPPEGSFQKTKHQNPFLDDLSDVTNSSNCAWYWKELIEKYKDRCYSKGIFENRKVNNTIEHTIAYPF